RWQHRKLKPRGHHPNDLQPDTIERERASQRSRIASEAGLPEVVTQHSCRRTALVIILSRETAAENRLHAEQWEEIRADRICTDARRRSEPGQHGTIAPV